ncbi:MAG: amino acid synthesis family protein [Alphaproteobacteria bacterium]|nr:amino acid synthesis family protein [Alphaproteobacteria bacterium]
MTPDIRRTILNIQTTHIEGGEAVPVPTKLISAFAIIRNPWFGRGFVRDLKPEVKAYCPIIGKLLTGMILDVTGDRLEGCGKASLVGMGGELEHAQALTHSLWFGNEFRNAVKAKTYLAFTNGRGGAGSSIMIPLMDKDDAGRRSHYQTIHSAINDAPADDEIVIALGASIGGHPLHRIGDRYEDLREMGHSIENPAGV